MAALEKTKFRADECFEMKYFSEAIKCYEEWLKHATKDNEQEQGEVYVSLGTAYQELYNSIKAIECYEKLLVIAKSLQDQRMEIKAYQGLENLHFIEMNYKKAIGYYEKELECAAALKDKNIEAKAHSNLAVVYWEIKNYAMAIEQNETALTIAVAIGDKNVELSANENLGNVYRSQGDYRKAIKYHERQLQISTDIGSKDGQARAYGCLGIDYKALGNICEARKYLTTSMQMCSDIGNKSGEAKACGNLGAICSLVDQHHEAIEYNKKRVEITREIHDRYDEGIAIGNLGTTFMKIGNYKEAVNCFEDSLKIADEVNNRKTKGIVFINLAKCKTLLGQYNEALEVLDKQIHLGKEIKDTNQESVGYISKGDLYMELQDYQQAIHNFEKGLEAAKEGSNTSVEANCYRNLGMLYGNLTVLNQPAAQDKMKENLSKAIHYVRESLRCSELLFDYLQEQDQLKISNLETFIKDYNFLSFLLIRNNESKEALLASERGRARALDDVLVTKYHLNKSNQSRPDPISYAEIESIGSDCSIVFYSSPHSIFKCAWVVGSVDSSPLLIDFSEARLSSIVNNAFSIMNVREVKCEDRSVQADELQEKRCIFDEDLYNVDNPNPLEDLHKAFISPMLHLLTKDEIVIIPDGSLFKVPFATLRDPNTGQFLSETKRIRLAPSLTSLKTLKDCPADFHSKTGALIIGNPKVGKVAFRGKTRTIADLPCAEREARKIGELLGVKPFIGLQATKDTIKQSLQEGVAVIHFAAHGTTDGEIFLTPSSTEDLPSEQDYILTMKEVQESGVRPQLVVLSCCHSGRGEIKAEGVVGMSRAFLAAGARAVIASLWAIADEATMVFMEKFYTHLKHGESASQSLQAAMKDMRKTPRYSDEQFWGPFFLIGDDVTIKL